MKRMVDELLIEKLKTLSKEINYNKENNTLEIGGNLEVDGSSKLNNGFKLFARAVDKDGNNPIDLYCETIAFGNEYQMDYFWGFCNVYGSPGFYLNDGSDRYYLTVFGGYELYITLYTIDLNIPEEGVYTLVESTEVSLQALISNVITHSVYITGQGGDISFNFTSLKNTPIDSVQDLYLYLKNDKFACNGYYEDSSGNKEFIYYLSLGTDITQATINDSAVKLTEAIGTNLLIKDDVKEIY